ncbi:MAG: hypothetical protein LC775_02960 [Acidobacteria bacterium]|nr:hypothetical protein [Acidobacteriota bacterium]
MLRSLALLVLWVMAASMSVAQGRAADNSLAQTTPGNCEMNAALLDSVRQEALEEAIKDGAVIVIARLGNGETSRAHNRRRLLIAKNYLSKYGLPAQKVITAEGQRVSGYGRVELYVAGKLRVVLLANRNKPMCVECCDPDDADFYPYRRKRR